MSSESISNLDASVIRKEIAGAALGGYIYAIGGYDYNVNYRLVERYEPTRDQWVPMASLSSLRGDAVTASSTSSADSMGTTA